MDDLVTYSSYDTTNDGDFEKPGEWRFIIAQVVVVAITVAVSVVFILKCLTTPKIRQNTSKWLQMLVALSVLIHGMLSTFFDTASDTGAHRIWKLGGLCNVLRPLYMCFMYLIPYGMVAVSVERLVSLWKRVARGSSFGKKTTIAVAVGLVLVVLGTCITLHAVYNGAQGVKVEGVYLCVIDERLLHVELMLPQATLLVLVVLTIIMVAKLVKTRHCNGGDGYPLNRILPFILANVLMIVRGLLLLILADLINSHRLPHMTGFLVLLIWMLGQPDTRTASYCPCLAKKKKPEAEAEMV